MSESAKELTQILNELNLIALQLGMHFATHKCKVFGVTKSGNKSKANISMNGLNINNPKDPMEYLGARLLNNLSWLPSDNKLVQKVKTRLSLFRPRHLRMNTVRTVLMSKVLSIPRYLSSVTAVPPTVLSDLEISISGTIKKKLGCNFKLSKAVIYGDKQFGGLDLVSPVDIQDIECTASVCRFVNSTSTITCNVARSSIQKALRGKSTDSLWSNASKIIHKLNGYFKSTENGWILCDRASHNPITNLRESILQLSRTKRTISELGQLDLDLDWHRSTLSYWRNHNLSYYQQRLLFLNLHHAIILDNNTTCDSCNVAEDWTHVFTTCSKSNFEKQELYATWDNISSKYNLDPIRLPADPTRNSLIINFDGRCTRTDWLHWSKHKRIPKAVALEVFKAFAIFIENCYKNTKWYNRPSRHPFSTKPKYQSAYFRQQHPTTLNLNPNHSNVVQSN